MIRTENRYCACCARTQRFLDLGAKLVCPSCSKLLWRTMPTHLPRIMQLFRRGRPAPAWRAG